MRHRRSPGTCVVLIAVLCFAGSAFAHVERSVNPDYRDSAGPPLDVRTDLLAEGFEGTWPPAGWEIITLGTTNTWDQTSGEVHSGDYATWLEYGPQGVPQDEWLVTPAVDLSTVSSAYLTFYEAMEFWPGYGEHHYVGVSTTSQTDPGAFTMLVDWTPVNHSIPSSFEDVPVRLNLEDYLGETTVYLCFRYTGTWADSWYIDDVKVYEPFLHDVALVGLSPADAQFADAEAVAPEVLVENVGRSTETFDVELVIEESGTVVYTETVSMTLTPEAIDTAVFPAFTATGGNYYDFSATALLPTDAAPEDNDRSAKCNSYTQTHVPLGWLHTNAGCGPCAPANRALDDWMLEQGDNVALIRTHTWWPYSQDILFLQNQDQNVYLINTWGADFTPHFWVDGIVDLGAATETFIDNFGARLDYRAPGAIELSWQPDSQTAQMRVDVREPLDPTFTYRLKLCVTEDDYFFAGGNGENLHFQALRRMLPDTLGVVIEPTTGIQTLSLPVPFETFWEVENLNLTAFIQDDETWQVWAASTGSLEDLTGRVWFDPRVTTMVAAEYDTLDLRIKCGQTEVKGVDVKVEFDRDVVLLQEILPGPWITESGLSEYFHDWMEEDTLHLSLAFLDGVRGGEGVLARCVFHPVSYDSTELTFSADNGLRVRDELNNELAFVHSEGDSIYSYIELTANEGAPAEPAFALRLLGNSPNPFNPTTKIRYELPAAGDWRVTVYDPTGRRVRVLQDGWQTAGRQELVWNGRDERGRPAGSGLYLLRVSGAEGAITGKMLLLK